MLAALILAAEGSGQGGTPGSVGGVLLIVGIVLGLIVFFALLYTFVIRRTRRERTSHGTQDSGPGRS